MTTDPTLTTRVARARAALAVLERQPAVDARGDVVVDARLATEKWLIQRAGHVHLRIALDALDAAEAEVARLRAAATKGPAALAHTIAEAGPLACARALRALDPATLTEKP